MAARNMYRIEINILVHEKELCVKLVIYKDRIKTFIRLQNFRVGFIYRPLVWSVD